MANLESHSEVGGGLRALSDEAISELLEEINSLASSSSSEERKQFLYARLYELLAVVIERYFPNAGESASIPSSFM